MVDYTRSTGASGTMMMRDLGGRIEFWLKSGDSATWFSSATFRYTSPHVPGGATWSAGYSSGNTWQLIGTINTSVSGNVSWTVPNTGTYGIGGPTTQTVYIQRATVPPAPSPIGVDQVTHNSFRYRFSSTGTGGSPVREWQIGYGTSATTPQHFTTSSGTSTINVGFPGGTTVYMWSRGRNDVGWGPWSVRSLAELLPGPPTPTAIDQITATGFRYRFTAPSNGNLPILEYEVGYGLGTDSPTSFVKLTGTSISIDTTYTPSSEVYVWVRARNKTGWGPWSSQMNSALLPGLLRSVVIDSITHTSFGYRFTAPASGNVPILEYEIGYGTNASTVQTSVKTTSTSATISPSNPPGTLLYVWGRARNKIGWGAWTPPGQVQLLQGCLVKVSDVWKHAIPYVKTGGVWKPAVPYVKKSGSWQPTASP